MPDLKISPEKKRPSVLMVESDYTQQRMFQYFLGKRFDLSIVGTMEEAIVWLDDQKPDLITSCMLLPRREGFTLLDRVKKNQETQDIPFVFVTALESEETRLKALETGAAAYITKPLILKDLAAQLDDIIEL